jgi:hypothetical protein
MSQVSLEPVSVVMTLEQNTTTLTSYLFLEPLERQPGHLLVWRAVREGVRDGDVLEVAENGALHRQLVQIRVQEGDDPLRVRRRTVELHGWRRLLQLWNDRTLQEGRVKAGS